MFSYYVLHHAVRVDPQHGDTTTDIVVLNNRTDLVHVLDDLRGGDAEDHHYWLFSEIRVFQHGRQVSTVDLLGPVEPARWALDLDLPPLVDPVCV